jgi:hypothetical protein
MTDWVAKQLAAGLPAFAGTAISGTVAVKDDLVNELLQQWLAARGGAAGPPLDLEQIKPFIKSATVRAEHGAVLVDFSISV